MRRLLWAAATAGALVLTSGVGAAAGTGLTQISSDPYTNPSSQHQTQVEPDTFSFGSTIVSAFQSGRFLDGGASNVVWATSADGGSSWTSGPLPGTTAFASPAGPYDRDTDPSVAYDAKHGTWLIASLPLVDTAAGTRGAAILVSRSVEGTTWGAPVTAAAASGGQDFDKDWIVCDDTPTSPHYGNCYLQLDDFAAFDLILMSTSTDGGLHWSTPRPTADRVHGLGGQPVVRPDGTVIVPTDNGSERAVKSFVSTDGGASWGPAVRVARIHHHRVAGHLRGGPLVSAEIDGGGRVYVAWEDCRFEPNCTANDIVMTTSTDGVSWSAVGRVPIDAVRSRVDHFLPGIGVDRATSGTSAHIGVTYYFYPSAACTSSTCQLDVGFVSSTNGGGTWSTPTQLAGPMSVTWLADTTQGLMVGDYISTSFDAGGLAHGVFAVAGPPSGGTLAEAMYASGLPADGGTLPMTSSGVVSRTSDYPAPVRAFARRR